MRCQGSKDFRQMARKRTRGLTKWAILGSKSRTPAEAPGASPRGIARARVRTACDDRREYCRATLRYRGCRFYAGGLLKGYARGRRTSVKPDEARHEIKRLEDERLRLSPDVMGGDPAAVAEDRRLERRRRELASTGRGTGPDRARDPERRDDPGGAA